MHYYKFNIGDYASHTQHLDPLEDIAYRRMLDWVYLHESPLPDSIDQIARLVRMRTHTDCIKIALHEFFTLTDHGWIQEKAFNEIDAYKEKSTKAKASAAARWSKKTIDTDANALRTECEGNANHKPLTTKQEPVTKDKVDALDWSKLNSNDEGIEGIKKCRKDAKLEIKKGDQRALNMIIKQTNLCIDEGYSMDQILNEWSVHKKWALVKPEYLKGKVHPETLTVKPLFSDRQEAPQKSVSSSQGNSVLAGLRA